MKNVFEILRIFVLVALVIAPLSFLLVPLSLIGAYFIYAAKEAYKQKPFWPVLATFSGSVVGFSIGAVHFTAHVTNPIYFGIWNASYAIVIYFLCAISPFFVRERY